MAMIVVPVSKARMRLTAIINKVRRGKRVILPKRGKRFAAIVPLDDLDVLEKLEDQLDIAAAKRVEKDIEKCRMVPWSNVKKKLGL